MKTINVIDFHNRFDDFCLVDVRELVEHRSQNIDGSVLIPVGEISVEKLPWQTKPLVLYCRSGKRSADACIKLLAQSPDIEVYSLEGGIMAWESAGFEVKKSEL